MLEPTSVVSANSAAQDQTGQDIQHINSAL